MCEGVKYLHDEKVIHHNLKPSNIFINHDPNTHQLIPMITDMGLCKEMDDRSELTGIVGTVRYLSPE